MLQTEHAILLVKRYLPEEERRPLFVPSKSYLPEEIEIKMETRFGCSCGFNSPWYRTEKEARDAAEKHKESQNVQ